MGHTEELTRDRPYEISRQDEDMGRGRNNDRIWHACMEGERQLEGASNRHGGVVPKEMYIVVSVAASTVL